jgi:hypothetical protein
VRLNRVLVVAVLLAAVACRPRLVRMTAPSGRFVDVINIRRLNRVQMDRLAVPPSFQSCIYLSFYQRDLPIDTTAMQLGDAVAIAMSQAEESGDSTILIERNNPVLSRWIGLVHGERYAFRLLPTGRWRPISL